jgi:hypothetical protein
MQHALSRFNKKEHLFSGIHFFGAAPGYFKVLELYMGGGAEIDNVKDGDGLYGHPFVLAVAKDNPSVNFACTAGFRFGFILN